MNNKAIDKKELIQRFRTEGILDAARKVIAQRGLDKTTMEQVAEEAGISKATIYLYFKNKDGLYYHCVISRFDEILEAMKAAVAGIDDPVKRLEVLIHTQVKDIESDKDFFKVLLTERSVLLLDKENELSQEFAIRHKEFSGLIIDALKDGIASGVLRPIDPTKGFYMLSSMVRGMAVCKLIAGEGGSFSSEADLILDVFWRGLKKS
ncbi:MAG: TetR/AcrR family transcriptional regulator [Nitrospirota bacterium]